MIDHVEDIYLSLYKHSRLPTKEEVIFLFPKKMKISFKKVILRVKSSQFNQCFSALATFICVVFNFQNSPASMLEKKPKKHPFLQSACCNILLIQILCISKKPNCFKEFNILCK
uniref:Uncharacterized protein n=1 Tax=Micrurus lemniscatus lemniscatus TaxID=129467 RepID=A0A2D4IS79_MICLE